MKKFLLIFFISLIIVGGFFSYRLNFKKEKEIAKEIEKKEEDTKEEKEVVKKEPEKTTPTPPQSKNLSISFSPQAPYALWDELHNNACEEAAIIMVHYYKMKKTLNKKVMENEIQKMVDFQIKNYGGHNDLNGKEIGKLASDFYEYKEPKIVYNFSWEEVKNEIVAGNPVIVPAAGRLLKNPYYKTPGPIYHALVIRGYSKDKIITNDPGTKRGENYQYSYKILDNALHEWTGSEETLNQGKKVMIVLE